MRTLTKTGIRILSAKYRSILIKCALINASMFIGMFGGGGAMAADNMTWGALKEAIQGATSGATISIPNSITNTSSEIGGIDITKNITLQGGNDIFLSGNNQFIGFNLSQGKTVGFANILFKDFTANGDYGGAIYITEQDIVNITDSDFIGNTASFGGAISNYYGTLTNIIGDFTDNTATATDGAANGGAIYNTGTIENITGNFEDNTATSTDNPTNGGAIYNDSNSEIGNIKGDFKRNHATSTTKDASGGAIYNTGGTITNITGNFESNSATKQGGAINNYGGSAKIGNITGNFKGNHADGANGYGGAIYNGNIIENITGDFENNYTLSTTGGGAIFNTKTINISTSDISAPDRKSAILFKGNYVTAEGSRGGAIYNIAGTVGLYAKGENDTITFVGGEDDTTNNKYDIDGIYNQATLNINGFKDTSGAITKYAGTVNLYNVSDAATAKGTTNIYGGNVSVAKDITQNNINVKSGAELNSTGNIKVTGNLTNDGTVGIYGIDGKIKNNAGGSLTFNDTTDTTDTTAIVDIDLTNSGTVNFNGQLNAPDFKFILTQNGGVMNFSTTAIESTAEYGKIDTFTMNGGSVDIADGRVNTLHINQLKLTENTNFAMDADLAAESMDKIQIHDIDNSEITAGKVININKINLLSDATQEKISLSIFADKDTKNALINNVNVHANINGLQYSSIYKYDANYDDTEGKITFTRYNSGTSDDFNPYLYAPSVVANTTAAMTTQIATLAMDKMDDVVHAQGRSGGDTPTSSNVWVKVMGLNDNVEFNNFENIDSKAMTVTAGYNTNKITCGDCGIVFGVYAGYIGGKQQYTANDIDQNGGYVGLSSALTLGDVFLTATVNGGLLKNKANNMYGTDRFNTRWLGAGLKTGYNYAITDSVVLQPNVYGGYTLVNTEDYTSVSGVKIATNNLNFFEVDPGLKLSAVIADGWTTSVHGKYAIVMDNGADITVNDIALQNISTKNYIEYGVGIDKSLTDAFYLGAKINRHDGGRTGWNGSIEFRYEF